MRQRRQVHRDGVDSIEEILAETVGGHRGAEVGVLDAAMESHHRRGARVEVNDLDIKYTAPADSGFLRGSVAAEG